MLLEKAVGACIEPHADFDHSAAWVIRQKMADEAIDTKRSEKDREVDRQSDTRRGRRMLQRLPKLLRLHIHKARPKQRRCGRMRTCPKR